MVNALGLGNFDKAIYYQSSIAPHVLQPAQLFQNFRVLLELRRQKLSTSRAASSKSAMP